MHAGGIVATVHRFQGNEKNVMLLDLTDSYGVRLGRFLAATHVEEDGARLLNAAMSRARHHVILVTNFDFLRAKASHSAMVRPLIRSTEIEPGGLVTMRRSTIACPPSTS